MELALFVLLSLGLIIVPGPNVIVIITTSVVHGRSRGLQTVAGTSAAMIVQLLVAALGTAWFVNAISEGLKWLKWLGVAYLVYLGFRQLKASMLRLAMTPPTALGSFNRGFWVSLTNPKTILFFGAFMPQFVSPQQSYLAQVAVLSSLFWVMAITLDSLYALLSSKIASKLKSLPGSRATGLFSGGLYLGAGAALATVGQE
ncbi:MAG: lysine transporter LysE [Gammaproteobacteria bacterium]|nr:lysine transporter LysE [Gammaproteobacteria bacterium]MBJ54160.1 lysine transporter LysE [Gammaproteobacteria bacterium]HBN13990.1 LysE family translocator [Pseudohongiella sp.]|tara:strand:+ start:2759 stop:3361 length:603 start_codon:yes stop_codon:yes gene_type:complete